MITEQEAFFIGLCLEGFFYGLYSGIFVMYLQCPSESNKSGTTTILFYALCLLYVLSTVTFVGDLLSFILELSLESRVRTLPLRLQIDPESRWQPMLFHISIVQTTASGCCDFIAQCIIIYRCWIVWGQNIRVVIIPSFLAIACLVTWLVPVGARTFVPGQFSGSADAVWGNIMFLISYVASMIVNTLVTGLIVFKILKVSLKVKPTSVERILGPTGGTKFRHIIFVIIESGMALFATQLVRVTLVGLPTTIDLVIGINQMFNGIAPTIILVRVSMRLSFDDKESFMEVAESLCFNNPPSDPNTLRRVGSGDTSSMPPRERSASEDT